MPTHIAVVYGGSPWISNDDGETWEETALPIRNYSGVSYDPFTATYWFAVYDTGYKGVYKSSDLINLVSVYTDFGVRRPIQVAASNGKISVSCDAAGESANNYYYSADNGATFAVKSIGTTGATNGICYDGASVICSGMNDPPYDPPMPGSFFRGTIGDQLTVTNYRNGNTHGGIFVDNDMLWHAVSSEWLIHAPRSTSFFDVSIATATTKQVMCPAPSNNGILVTVYGDKISRFDPVAKTFTDTNSQIKNWQQIVRVDTLKSLSLYVPRSGSWTKVNELHQGGASWRKDSALYVPNGGAWKEVRG